MAALLSRRVPGTSEGALRIAGRSGRRRRQAERRADGADLVLLEQLCACARRRRRPARAGRSSTKARPRSAASGGGELRRPPRPAMRPEGRLANFRSPHVPSPPMAAPFFRHPREASRVAPAAKPRQRRPTVQFLTGSRPHASGGERACSRRATKWARLGPVSTMMKKRTACSAMTKEEIDRRGGGDDGDRIHAAGAGGEIGGERIDAGEEHQQPGEHARRTPSAPGSTARSAA